MVVGDSPTFVLKLTWKIVEAVFFAVNATEGPVT